LLFSGSGCGSENEPVPPEATLREDLSRAPVMVSLVTDPPGVAMHSTITPAGGTPAEYDYELGVMGTVTIRADAAGNLLLADLALDVDDLTISMMALPPDGLTLTDFRVAPVETIMATATWSTDGTTVDAQGTGALLVDWGFIDDMGATVPLAQLRVDDVQFVASAVRGADGTLDVEIDATVDGDFFTWASLATLSDLRITARGTVSP
jgi:hypothetical protein